MSADKAWLASVIPRLSQFLRERLHLELHPDKLTIRTLSSGVDFLGWVHFPHHRTLRTVTKRRAWRRLKANPDAATLNSYLGLLQHGNAHMITTEMQAMFDDAQSTQESKTQRVKKI
jgi:hypothetical protein